MKSNTLLITIGVLTCLTLGLSQTASGGGHLGHLGSHEKWTKLEVDLKGPASQGMSNSPNPFLIEVDVTISGPGGSFVVPAFYAGNGDGGMDGEIWKVRFSPNAVGPWSFSTSSSDPVLDGYSGTFAVSEPTGCGPYLAGGLPDFSCAGRLEWTGDHYLKFVDGPYWLKGGVDDPEDFLADGQTVGFPTKQDAIDFLAGQSINSLYFMTQNVGGDRNNVSPWIGGDTDHFDIAKLDAWDVILDALHEKGIVLHLVLEDDSGSTSFNRPLYYRQIVARFGHYNGLYWNLTEEYEENYTANQVKGFAQLLSDLDPYDHPMTVHILRNLDHWLPFLGDDRFDLTSFHSNAVPQNNDTSSWFQLTEDAGRIVAISFDETGDYTADRTTNRHIVWSIFTGGGMYEIHTRPLTDYRDWGDFFADILRARTFIEMLPFWQMRPTNQLLVSGTGYVFSKPGSVYVAYLPTGGAIELDLSSNTNLFDVSWYDPRTGAFTDEGNATGGSLLPFTAPDLRDWVLLLEEDSSSGNVAPVATDQNLSTPLDTSLQLGLSFVDPDGPGPYFFTVVQPPLSGSLSAIDPLGIVTYTPNTSFSGTDQFQWTVDDGIDESNLATVSILVDPPNSPPVAQDGSATTQVDTAVDITLQASDVEGDALTYQIVTAPANGTLSGDDGDNLVTYTPDPGFEGGDSFTFLADDGDPSNVATVTVTVDSTPIVAFEDDFNRADAEAVGNGWVELEQSGAVVRIDGQALYFHDTSDRLNRPLVRHDFPQVSSGVLRWDFDFNWQRSGSEGTYRVFMQLGEAAQMSDDDQDAGVGVSLLWSRIGGIHETLGYRSGSGDTGLAQISGLTNIAVIADVTSKSFEVKIDDVSVGTGLPFHNVVSLDTIRFFTDNVNESNFAGQRFDTVVLAGGPPPPPNDPPTADDQSVSVSEDDSLPITLTGSDPDLDPLTYGIVTGPSQGALSGTAPDVTYTPNPDYFGADSFTFQVDDGVNPPVVGTVSITVNSVNDPPVAQDGSATTQVDTAVDITLQASDVEGDALTYQIVTAPANGTLSGDDGDNLVTYTPDPGFEGGDSFTFLADDGDPSNVATVTVTVDSTPIVAFEDDFNRADAEAVGNGWVELEQSGAVVRIDGQALYFHDTSDRLNRPLVRHDFPQVSSGVLRWDFDFNWQRSGSEGTYRVFMQLGEAAQMSDDDQDAGVGVSLLWSRIGGIHQTLGYRSGSGDTGLAQISGLTNIAVIADVTSKSFEVKIDDVSVGTGLPFHNVVSLDTIRFFTDNVNESNFAGQRFDTVVLAGGPPPPPNDPPTADDQSVSVSEDDSLPITLTGSDPDLDPLTYGIVTGPSQGALSGTAPDVTYTPNPDYFGADSFTFQVDDGVNPPVVGTVSITVNSVNDPPVAQDGSATTQVDTAVDITLQASDVEGDALTYQIVTAPANGTLSGDDGDNLVTYTPDPGFEGGDSFTFLADDGDPSNVATVSVTVQEVPTAPFTDITTSAGTAGPSDGGHGVMFADVNQDGLPDLYLTNILAGARMDYFFLNQGVGVFSEEGQIRGIEDLDGGSHGAVWADLDNDGDYDLANGSTWDKVNASSGNPEPDNVYRNDGTGNFTDVTPASIQSIAIETRGLTALDMDGDGDLDLFGVPGSSSPGVNEAYLNQGNFGFDLHTGGDLSSATAMQGVTDTDYDGDGDVDILAANRSGSFAVLNNDGTGIFTEVSPSSLGINDDADDGITTADVDNDGDLDLLLVSNGTGKLYLRGNGGQYTLEQSFTGGDGYMGGFADLDHDGDLDLVFAGDNGVYLNDGAAGFSSGPSVPVSGINDPRAIAFADIDNDGDLDFAIAVKGTRNWLVRNDLASGNWLKVQLTSSQGQAGAFGAWTYVYPAGQIGGTLLGLRESKGNQGYLGQDDPVLHFGLGTHSVVDVVVEFPNGTTSTITDVPTNGLLIVAPTPNDPPTADDQSVGVPEDGSLPITLTGSDPDLDPLTFGIVSGPSLGALSGTAPNVTYTPNPDYFGGDSFTFQVDDGVNPPDQGLVSITVTPVNDAPVAQDGIATTQVDTAAVITLQASDVEVDALTYQIVTAPTDGTLSGDDGGNQVTYTPDPGFEGVDCFTFLADDGTDPSNVATVTVTVDSTPIVAFEDDFNRADAEAVGNGWVELEQSGAAVKVNGQALYFHDTSDRLNRPLVRHDFSQVTSGVLRWDFDFNWQRSGSEGTYRVFMQLGEAAQMSDDDQDAGVGVSLLWSVIGGIHETLGYRRGSGDTGLAQISGLTHIAVIADATSQSFEVQINDVSVGTGLPFHNVVSLDTVRLFTDNVNERNFANRTFDSVVLVSVP